MPKVAPTKYWLAKILVEVLIAHDLTNIGKKNKLELARVHWHGNKLATIQTKTNLWVMTKILVGCTLATIQTYHFFFAGDVCIIDSQVGSDII